MGTPESGRRAVCLVCRQPSADDRRVVQFSSTRDSGVCEECVAKAQAALRAGPVLPASGAAALPTPPEIKARLDEYVVGQDAAKRALAVAVYQHYRRIEHNARGGDLELGKSNILLVGPTGSGKTLLAQVLARVVNVPFAIYDATSLTEAGYVGEDVENVLLRLYQNAELDVLRAERGMVYLDEVDKIGRKAPNPSITRDVNGEGVQQALLKIIEGTQANVPKQGGRKHPTQEYVQMNTHDILFICGGTFDGIDKIHRRSTRGTALGFGRGSEGRPAWYREETVSPRDLIEYGLIPELVGRLPIVVTLNALTEDDLVRVLEEPRDALLRQYRRKVEMDGGELEVTDGAKRAIARLALQRGLGARGLRALVDALLEDALFDLPALEHPARVIVDEKAVDGSGRVRVEKRRTRRRASAPRDAEAA